MILNEILLQLSLDACQSDPQKRPTDARQLLDAWERQQAIVHRHVTLRPYHWTLVAASLLVLFLMSFWLHPSGHTSINFITEALYFEATIYLDGKRLERTDGTPYTTPCTVDNLSSRVHNVVFKHTNAPDLSLGPINFSQIQQVVGRWQ